MTLDRGEPASGVDPSEAELVREMLAGRDAAFEALFARHRGRAQALVRQRVPGRLMRRVSIADVLQEAHWTAYENRLAFEDRGPNSFRNWLLKIAELKTKEVLRRHAGTAKRDVGREVTRGERVHTGQFRGKDPSPSQVAIGEETANRARMALARLSTSYREILQLTRHEHRTLHEAAELTGRSYAATRKLVARALARFASEYEKLQRGES